MARWHAASKHALSSAASEVRAFQQLLLALHAQHKAVPMICMPDVVLWGLLPVAQESVTLQANYQAKGGKGAGCVMPGMRSLLTLVEVALVQAALVCTPCAGDL